MFNRTRSYLTYGCTTLLTGLGVRLFDQYTPQTGFTATETAVALASNAAAHYYQNRDWTKAALVPITGWTLMQASQYVQNYLQESLHAPSSTPSTLTLIPAVSFIVLACCLCIEISYCLEQPEEPRQNRHLQI